MAPAGLLSSEVEDEEEEGSDSDIANTVNSHHDSTMNFMMYFYTSHLPMISYTLPLQYMSSDDFLKAYVYIADRTGKYDHFDNENVKVAIIAAWENRGFNWHMVFCGYFMSYLALLSCSNYCYQLEYCNPMEMTSESAAIVVLSMTAVLLVVEGSQCYNLGLYSFMLDFQNWLEVVSCVLVIIGTTFRIRIANDTGVAHDTLSTEILMAIGTVLAWFNALNLLRPFSYTGPLIQMMYTVTAKIIPFFIMLMVIIFGFSQAFFLLANDSDPNFDTIEKSYLYSFIYVSGGAQYVVTGEDKNDVRVAVEVLYVAFVQVMVLNLLIAFLNHIYSDIQDQAEAVGSYERCKMIISHLRWESDGDKWIHYIKNQIDVENYEQDKIDKDYTNSKIKDDLQLAEKNQKGNFDLLDTKIDNIDRRTKSIEKMFSDQTEESFSASQSRKSFGSERRLSFTSGTTSGKNVSFSDGVDNADDSIIKDNHDIKWLEMRLDNIEKDRKKDFQVLCDKIQDLSRK